MITKTCKQCNTRFEVYPSQAEKKHFCSCLCYDKWRSDNLRGENNPNWRGGNIIKRCELCGTEYEIKRNLTGRNRFCSYKCYHIWQSGNMRGEKNHRHRKKVKIVCEQCGTEFEDSPSDAEHRRFCSLKCKYKGLSGENSPMHGKTGENSPGWRGGLSFEPYCHKFNEAFKESVREKFDRVCFLCPTTEEENGKKLSVHHVNYDKDCLCDDSECEFVPLCTKCHSKTNFNRDYWENLIMEKLEVIQCT